MKFWIALGSVPAIDDQSYPTHPVMESAIMFQAGAVIKAGSLLEDLMCGVGSSPLYRLGDGWRKAQAEVVDAQEQGFFVLTNPKLAALFPHGDSLLGVLEGCIPCSALKDPETAIATIREVLVGLGWEPQDEKLDEPAY